MNRVRRLRAGVLLVTAVSLVGCGSATSHSKPLAGLASTAQPGPKRTVYRAFPTYDAGQTGVLNSPSQHASLRISVAVPSRSTTPLSKAVGYPPKFGNYLTFRLTIRNTGQVPVVIRRLDFWVRTPGARKTTTNDGNAPFSGSSSQLDTTQLSPRQAVTNDLTFDVAHPAGTLFYAPGGHRALAWRFRS